MDNKIIVGIINENFNKKREIEEISYFINNNLNYKHSINIENYELLKKSFIVEDDIKFVVDIEANKKPAMSDWKQKIILFGNLFFEGNRTLINKQAIFLHEIGHLLNGLKKHNDNPLIKELYNEFLADRFILEMSKEIFEEGRIKEDIILISENKQKRQCDIILSLGRLYYYNSLCPNFNILNDKIKRMEELIEKKNKPILDKLRKLCDDFNTKDYTELIEKFIETEEEINKIL
jgi:hypothetical protein